MSEVVDRVARAGVLVVIGASGSGKTAAVRVLADRELPAVRCFYFDSIGVPSSEVMEREFGSGPAWQEDATLRWFRRLDEDLSRGEIGVLEGQTRPSFIETAADGRLLCVEMVLVDCDPDVRAARLAERGQPGLAGVHMDRWAAYLLGQADALGLPVIDSSGLSIPEVADALESKVRELRDIV